MKIKIISIKILTVNLLFALFSSQGFAVSVTKSFDFLRTDFTFEKEKGYDRVSLKNADHTIDFGKPLLPAKVYYFAIPPDAEVSDVNAISRNSKLLEGEYNLMPAQPPKSENRDFGWIEQDLEVYNSSTPYPQNLANLIGEGYFTGYKIVSVIVFPLQYTPITKRLLFHSEIEVTLTLKNSVNTSIPVERMSRENQEMFRNMVKGMVANPHDVDFYSGVLQTVETSKVDKLVITDLPTSHGTAVEYVIITSDALAPQFQVLADWKTKRGVPATVRTTSWIQANYPNGADLAETIRKFIQDAYSNWGTVWILLGGDSDVIPPRYAHVNQAFYYGENIPADYYYACLDGNWNDDGDGVFGEAVYDSVDFYPEIFIGRAPVQDTTETNTFINKVLKYAKPDSTAYLTKGLFLGTDMFQGGDGGEYCDTISARFPSWFTKTKLYESLGNENQQSVIDSLNRGFNLVYYQGHGSEYITRVKESLSGGAKEALNRVDMDTLKNSGKYTIFYAVTCNAGSIDHDAFFEHFLNNPNGGGVGAMSTTRFDYPFAERKFSRTFFDSLFTSSGNNVKIGKTEAMARIPYIGNSQMDGQHRFIQYSRILLADPEMDLWTKAPICLNATFPDSVPLGPTNFTVTVQTCIPSASAPVSSALVTLKKGDDDYAYGLTNSSGQITFDFTPETAGYISIIATKHDYLPDQDSSKVYVPNPYLVYKNHFIDDDTLGVSRGNSNGIIDAGETIEMPVVLKNTGNGTAYGVNAILTESSPYVTMIDSVENYANIPAGDTSVSLEDFDYTVTSNAPDNSDLTFTMNLSYSSGGGMVNQVLNSTDHFTPKIRAPKLEHFAHTVADTGCPTCNGDGDPDADEDFAFPVTVRNLWGGVAENVTGKLTTDNQDVILFRDSVYYATIQGNSDAEPIGQNFFIKLQPWVGVPIILTLTLKDSYNRTWVDTFDIYFYPSSTTGLSTLPGRTTIDLSWNKNPESDLLGYNVYRLIGGNWVRVNWFIVEGTSYYQDIDLSQATDYWYAITAVDKDRNERKLPSVIPATPTDATNPLNQTNWPYPFGLDVGLHSSPVVTRIVHGGGRVVIQGTDEGVQVGKMYVLNNSGVPLPGWPVQVNGRFRATPAVGNLDSDSDLEIINSPWSNDNKVYAWNPNGTPVSGWPRNIEGDPDPNAAGSHGIHGSPALGDLNGNGNLEVVVATMKGRVYAWKGDGTGLWNVNPDNSYVQRAGLSWNLSSPALGEVDTFPGLEIVVGSNDGDSSLYAWKGNDGTLLTGFPLNLGGGVLSSPVLGDIDPSFPGLEIVCLTSNKRIYVLHWNGTLVTGDWPKTIRTREADLTSPTLGDIDGDGALEILIGTEDGIYAFRSNGTNVPGWPVYRERESFSSPTLGDIDGDGDIEILVGSQYDLLYAYHHNGQKVKGFPIKTGYRIEATSALQDLDQDGDVEVILPSLDHKIYVWDLPGVYNTNNIKWGKIRHDIWNTGNYNTQVPELPSFLTLTSSEESETGRGLGIPKIYSLKQNTPNPFGNETIIQYQLPRRSHVELKIYNILGQEIQTIVHQSHEPGYYAEEWKGKDRNGKNLTSGVYFYRIKAGEFIATKKLILLR